MNEWIEVGAIVSHPQRPDWGRGQVQSIAGGRITVNFEDAGKIVMDADSVSLTLITPDWL